MKFRLSGEQREFGITLHQLLADAQVPQAARAWAAGDHRPGLAIWRAVAKAGAPALVVPESCGGLGASAVDLVVACDELGHHPVPGPIAESFAAVPRLLADLAAAQPTAARPPDAHPPDAAPVVEAPGVDHVRSWLSDLAAGDLIATVAAPPSVPYALDADIAGLVLIAERGQLSLASAGARWRSMDHARRLFEAEPAQALGTATEDGIRYGTLASAALLLGAGRGLLDAAVAHARTREQFGRPIGSFQAVRHSLADVLIALEFARPLVYAAAVALDRDAPTAGRDISAARVASADAARLAARTALQVHGAIGYTSECDLSLWLAKVRALSSVWGTQAEHRATVLAALAGAAGRLAELTP